MAGPFYIAWVEPEETTFGPEHEVEDEILESFKIDHSEGSIPQLTIRFKNTGEGPLAPGRKRWMWLSWESGGTDGIIPLFFGQVMAVPSDILGRVIEYKLYAKDERYDENLRALADTMRVAPFYDEVFVDAARRDDPDAVLEGYSKLWHVDRTPNVDGILEVTASDVLIGEDGTDPEEFTEAEIPHDTVTIQIGQNPLTSVTVRAAVAWTQTHSGTIDTGARAFATYSGSGVVSAWPKAGSSLGGGWTAAISGAVDTSSTSSADVEPMVAYTYTYTNKEKKHRTGDILSINISRTVPKPGVNATLQKSKITHFQVGIIDPFAVDEEGDPAPKSIPAETRATTTYVLGAGNGSGGVHTALVARYDAERQRTENLLLQVFADLQPIITESGQGDTITLSGNDVGAPLLRLETWNDVAGEAVALGRLIFPSYIGFPGARIPQRATTAGTTGPVLPDFSSVAGETTSDGGAVWTSLGVIYPDSTAEEWIAEIDVPVGRVILPRINSAVVTYAILMQSGLIQFPQTGTAVSEGQVVRAANGSYQQCTVSGVTDRRGAGYGTLLPSAMSSLALYVTPIEPAFSTTWGVTTVDGSVTWISLGLTVPNGTSQYICTVAGTAGLYLPPFNPVPGSTTTDGTVTWINIGTAEIPIGGIPGNVSASHYFPTDRGLQSIEYLLNVARARLLYRSRVVQISFDCRFERAVELSCRKNAIIYDRRIPGGQALGKIIAYSIEADGPAGVMKGNVTIGCAIGAGDEVVAVAGTPVYVDGVFNDGEVQQSEGATIILPTVGDIGYTPPDAVTVDDGLVFPLTPTTAILKSAVTGTITTQTAAINDALDAPYTIYSIAQSPLISLTIEEQEESAQELQDKLEQAVADNPYWYELQLPTVTNGPFNADYSLPVTDLMVPRMIDLEAT